MNKEDSDALLYHHPSRGAASLLMIGRNNLLKWMRKKGILEKDNALSQKYWGKKLFKLLPAFKYDTYAIYFSDDGINYLRPLIEEAIINGELHRPKKKKYRDPGLDIELVESMTK
jgi:hypothetical protein